MEPSIIVIGGGLTGLSAGCYGRMNGYRTSVFEMHSLPGGVCTAWERNGYTIDGAVNWVMGTGPGSSYHRIWQEVGAAGAWKIHNHDRAMIAENREGRALSFHCDADRLERHMLEIAPEDGRAIRELTAAIRRSAGFSMDVDKPQELYSILDIVGALKMLPMLRFMKKWSKISIGDFVARLRNPFLKKTFPLAFGSEFDSDWPMTMLIMMLGFHHSRLAGYIIGGGLPLARSIEKRYLDLGGEIHYNARVQKILVENGRAVGILLADGSEHRADWVVSAADGRTTIFDMLEGKYIDKKIADRYDNPNLFDPLVYVGLGVARQYQDLPAAMSGLTYPLDRPITIAGKEERLLTVRSYSFDPTVAPEGKDVLIVQFGTNYDYWNDLYKDQERYKAEKKRIAADVIDRLEQRFPGISDNIEMTDVATPITWERYTGNWRGSYEGWMFDMSSMMSSMKKTLPGLDQFYMAGQWVNPGGGISTAVVSGNHTVQLICRKDKKKFVASVPTHS
jgi:phytoene dehydrogenase-like protein